VVTKFRVWKYGYNDFVEPIIQEVDVYRETKHCVFPLPNSRAHRELKHPKWGKQYFDTKAEAAEFIKATYRQKISEAIAEKENLPFTFSAMEKAANQKISHARKLLDQVSKQLDVDKRGE
jgi:hypothetical protein